MSNTRMMEITISGNNLKHLQLIRKLAEELGLKIKTASSSVEESDVIYGTEKNNSEKLYQLMQEMAESGGLESIQDPIKWQRKIRKDKILYGRE